jgi:hypothetical protein
MIKLLSLLFTFFYFSLSLFAQSIDDAEVVLDEAESLPVEVVETIEPAVRKERAAPEKSASKSNEPEQVVIVPTLPPTPTAQEEKEDPYKDLPKSGLLSGTYSLETDSTAVSEPWGNTGSAANSNSPITGSVSRISKQQWKASVFNNSEDSFSVSVKVKQIDSRGSVVKSDYFSASLKPKNSAERQFSSASSALNAELELLSWKKLK